MTGDGQWAEAAADGTEEEDDQKEDAHEDQLHLEDVRHSGRGAFSRSVDAGSAAA